MNICADYDSLHYGLRSEYVLDNGGGIYENLGMVNVVYTYSKGLETLLLPISGLPSYGFFLSFQIWMTLGTLITAGQIVELFVGRKHAVGCMTLLSCIPGIMNMSITAKTDSMTVFMQLVMLLASAALHQEKEGRLSGTGGGCLPDDTRVKADGACIFHSGGRNRRTLHPAHKTAEI